MGVVRFNSIGYENAFHGSFSGITGNKKALLPMRLTLIIDDPPPPLFLFINPNTFSLATTKKTTPSKVRSNPTNGGYIIQHAFDELDVMTVSGITAMMYHQQYGLTSKRANQTAAHDQWNKILAIFRNNGVNYNSKQETIIDSIGRVAIFYDGIEYRGSFDDLNWKVSDQSPYNYEFSWTFTINETIDSNIYRGYSLKNSFDSSSFFPTS